MRMNERSFYIFFSLTVNVGGYIQAVLDRNLAENISRVLYPNDNVRKQDYTELHSQNSHAHIKMD